MEKVISHTRYKLTSAELEAFNSEVDHWLAELTMNKGRCEQVPDMRSCLSSGAMEQGSS
ncbi:TPA: hypothetical protein KWY89_001635 [Escherichia coli]|nr:hypothetical protein [Escherichia coli]